MKMRMFHASALVALAAVPALAGGLAAGCGSADCTSLCQQSNQCPGVNPMMPTDCAKSCASADTLNVASGCADDYEQVVSCAGSQPDVCTTPATACSQEIATYQVCIETFCMTKPLPPSCNATN
jgi:hypothetical protein